MTSPAFDFLLLDELADTDPERYARAIAELAKLVPADEARRNVLQGLAELAASGETLEAFDAFYEGIHGAPMLAHSKLAEAEAFTAREEGEIWLFMGFRGSRKTTTDQITRKAWLHGLHPEGTGVTTGANDPNAKLIAKSIAQIIEFHPFYRMAFPNVVVDKERGWGAEGYWIRDVRVSREEWTQRQAKVNDPSFVGGGYKSSEINGKHPTLYLSIDDLHDIDSSASVTEREAIKQVFFFQILPTVPRLNDRLSAWVELTGVPFAKDDTYADLRRAGGVHFTNVPVMRRVPENTPGAVYIDGRNPKTGVVYDDIVGWWFLTAPELFGVKSIIDARSKGKASFWQMYMLDIEVAKTAGLRYYLYNHKDVSYEWPTVGGADPTNLKPDKEVGGTKRSSFALCYLAKTPNGRAVVVDGVLKPCGILEAKEAILQAQSMFPNWRTTGVENVGGGAVFLQYLWLDSRVRCIDSGLTSPDHKRIADKKLRFLNETHPHMENAVIMISDLETPYNMALRRLCDNYFDLDMHDEAWDAGDGLYHAVKLIPEVLRQPVYDDLSPADMSDRGGLWHPFMGGRPTGANYGRQ